MAARVPQPTQDVGEYPRSPTTTEHSALELLVSRAPASLSRAIRGIAEIDRQLEDLLALRRMERVVNLSDPNHNGLDYQTAANGSSSSSSSNGAERNGGARLIPRKNSEEQGDAIVVDGAPSSSARSHRESAERELLMGLLGLPNVSRYISSIRSSQGTTNAAPTSRNPHTSTEEKQSNVDSIAAMRREIMGEVKQELMLEVQKRDLENMNKLSELERENLELRQELIGLLREVRQQHMQGGRTQNQRSEEEHKSQDELLRQAGKQTRRPSLQHGMSTRSRTMEQRKGETAVLDDSAMELEPTEDLRESREGSKQDEELDAASPTTKSSRKRKWKTEGKRTSESIDQENTQRWQMRVDELQAFCKEHGTWRVPKNHPNKPLYTWTQNVRQRWRRGALSLDKINELLSAGMVSPFEDQEHEMPHSDQSSLPTDVPKSATESDAMNQQSQERKGSTRPRAVKRAKRRLAPEARNEGMHNKSDSDDEYKLVSDQEDDSLDDGDVSDEEEKSQRIRNADRRALRKSSSSVPADVKASAPVTRKRAKSLTDGTAREETKRKAAEEANNSTDDDEHRDVPNRLKIKEEPQPSQTKAQNDEEEEIPDNPVNQKWLERYEALKLWVSKHGPERPNRKHEPSLGRWADQQMLRLKAGDLLPWRHRMLEEVGFFSGGERSS